MRRALIGIILLCLIASPSGAALSPRVGLASWYGWHEHGRTMANGHRFRALALTAASRTLPLGARIWVTNLANCRTVALRVTDRGPYARGRILDVSLGAARRLRMEHEGLARVRIDRKRPL